MQNDGDLVDVILLKHRTLLGSTRAQFVFLCEHVQNKISCNFWVSYAFE